ncbi:MAG: radical SAM protein [Candidatus Aminicenantes bacterium]|nr:MAG: radical SAM protein [Candidatus Aminicenantes bacterium]
MNQCIFVYPPATSFSAEVGGHFNLCLGAAYCISFLVQNGWKAGPILTNKPVNVSECMKQILANKPKVVGFTVYDSNYCSCQLIARSLKKAAPDIIILFGGPTASVQAKPILEMNDFVDICVRNEGEETCLELMFLLDDMNFDLKKTSASACLEKIKGITYRVENTIRENPGRDILLVNRNVRDFLDKYPSPYLNGLLDSPELGIITARGCNQHCIYCNCAVISNRIIATHSIDRVIEELDYISKKFGSLDPGLVNIFDDAFTLIPSRALEICNRIIENKIKLPLSCGTRCDKVNEELLEKMKEAGFKSIAFSLESAVPRLLRIIGKVHPPTTKQDPNFEKEKEFIEKLRKYTAYAKKIGIEAVSASIMIGLPTETREEGRQTLEMIRSLGDSLDNYVHNIFQIFPGTPVFFNHEARGMKLVQYDNRIHYQTIHNYDTNSIKPAPGSNLEEAAASQGRLSIKSLALFTSNKSAAGFFTKLILWADIISKELIFWLQKYMAVDGKIIQVCSNLDSARQYLEYNRHNLHKYISPTMFHPVFYQTAAKNATNGTITLTPFKRQIHGQQIGFKIKLVNTKTGLLCTRPGIDPSQTIGIDREKEDVLQLHNILAHLADKDNAAEYLFDTHFTPYISTLCRWENKIPNCQSLETVIVDSHNNVKTCWNGTPIGKVGMTFNELLENLRDIHRTIENKRDCLNCKKQAECARCIFSAPLTANEYCDLKKNHDTVDSAELLRTFDSFKELKQTTQ